MSTLILFVLFAAIVTLSLITILIMAITSIETKLWKREFRKWNR
jgi:hypothetical protein